MNSVPLYLKLAGSVYLLLLLNACGGMGTVPEEEHSADASINDEPIKMAAMRKPPVVNNEQRRINPAASALLDQAAQSQQRGDLNAAVAQVERALRIDSRSPQAYYQLATYRLKQGKAEDALQLVTKAIHFAPDSERMMVRLWELVALCNDYLGDSTAARRARERAADYQ